MQVINFYHKLYFAEEFIDGHYYVHCNITKDKFFTHEKNTKLVSSPQRNKRTCMTERLTTTFFTRPSLLSFKTRHTQNSHIFLSLVGFWQFFSVKSFSGKDEGHILGVDLISESFTREKKLLCIVIIYANPLVSTLSRTYIRRTKSI